MTESLPKLLLRLSEAGEPAILWGRQAQPQFGHAFDRLVNGRVLIEQAPATEWEVCGSCECGLNARPIEEIDGRLVAVCPLDHRADAVLAPEDRRSFRIDGSTLAREIARATGFDRAPSPLIASVWEIVRLPGDRAVVLVLSVAAASDPNLVTMVRAATRAAAITMLLPTGHDPSARRRIDDACIHTVVTIDVIGAGDQAASFTLDVGRLVPGPNIAPRLVIRRSAKSVVLDGVRRDLSDQTFQLLLLLAETARNNDAFVGTRHIEQHIWGVNLSRISRPVRDVVRELKNALFKGMADTHALRALVQNRKSPSGYRLVLGPSEVEILG